MGVIPRLRSNRQGVYKLILSCYSTAFFLSVIPQHFFSSCHTGLRAGIQVNIDSLAIWIPGQARKDSKKTSPERQKETEKIRSPLMVAVAARGDGYWVMDAAASKGRLNI